MKSKGRIILLWQRNGNEKGRGERQYEDDQIHKAAKKEFENAEKPALSINATDGQENLRHKRDPQQRNHPARKRPGANRMSPMVTSTINMIPT